MREAKDTDDVVTARMRALHDARPAVPPSRGEPATTAGPLQWSDIVPAWSEIDESRGDGRVGMPSGFSQPSDPEVEVPFDERYTWKLEEPPDPLPAKGAFGDEDEPTPRRWLHAFDPGRPGVRALAAVAVVVALVAAFLAWHARPRVDPVAPGLGSTPASTTDGSGSGSGTGTGTGSGSGSGSGTGTGPGTGAGPGGGSSPAEVVVAVGGKVRKPGLVRLAPGARVADALTAAGGAEPGVDVSALNLARKVTDGELIMVGVTPPPGATTLPAPAGTGTAGGLINLNTATLADLDTLPGVGPVLAQRILDARDAQGGFRAVTDLRKVDGIGDARYEQLKDLVTV